jgi:hypothetical protein
MQVSWGGGEGVSNDNPDIDLEKRKTAEPYSSGGFSFFHAEKDEVAMI